MCQTPISIINPKKDKKHGEAYIDVPCGKCSKCLKRRIQDWTFRLKQEKHYSKSCKFITLTYSDEHIPTENGYYTLKKADVQLFMKRLRKLQAKHTKDKIRYYFVGEYGTKTQRPHYHAIMFNLYNDEFIIQSWVKNGNPIGITDVQEVRHDGALSYVVSYINGKTPTENRAPEFSLMSKGLGKQYLSNPNTYNYHTQSAEYCKVVSNGFTQPMPRYYKNLIYTDDEKKQISEYMEVLTNTKNDKIIKDLISLGYPHLSSISESGTFIPGAELTKKTREVNAKHLKPSKKLKI